MSVLILEDINRLERLYSAGFQDTFLDNALRKLIMRQIARDEQNLANVTAALAQLERQHGITSQEFWQRFQAGAMPDTADAMEWNVLLKTQRRITHRLQILRDA